MNHRSMSEQVDHHDHDHGHGPARPWSRLRQMLQPENRDLISILIYASAVAILSLATPIAVETLVNTVSFGVLLQPLVWLSVILLSCLGLAAAIRALQMFVIEMLQRRLFVRIVADYSERLPRLKISNFDHQFGPELGNRFFDVLTLQKSLATLLLEGVSIIVTVLIGLVVLAFYHPFLLGYDIVLILLISFAVFVLGWGGVRSSIRESRTKYEVAAWLEEQLHCVRGFKFAGGNKLALARADQLASHYVEARQAHFAVVWRQTLFSLGLQVVASTVLLGLGGFLVINRQLTLGQLVAAELIVAIVVASVSKLGKYCESFYDLMSSVEKLGLIPDLPTEPTTGEPLTISGGGMTVTVKNLALHCPHRTPLPGTWTVPAGSRVAIDGPHGSGKTTLFEMISGLRDTPDGHVELDGIDLRLLNLESVRQKIGFVERPEIFTGTILENVRVGRSDVSLSAVREALNAVGLLNVIHDFPEGLETHMLPNGRPLSSSQSIQLMIARALVGEPRLLILDGCLDAIDLDECPNLLSTIFDRSRPWTVLISTSNPKIMAMCDRVIRPEKTQSPSTDGESQ